MTGGFGIGAVADLDTIDTLEGINPVGTTVITGVDDPVKGGHNAQVGRDTVIEDPWGTR